MKKKVLGHMGFQWEIIPWILMFPVVWGIIYWKVEEQFGYISKSVSVQRSIVDYMLGITIIMALVFLIIMLWWGIAFCKLGIKKSFEEKTFWWAIILIVVVGSVVYMGSMNSGIVDNRGEKQQLFFANYIFKGVIVNVLAFPPRNVKKVIFVGGDVGRLVLALGLSVIWYFI